MFYQVVRLSLLISILLYRAHYCDAVNSDYVLSYSNPNGDDLRYIEIQQKSTQGNGLSVCTWIKLTTPETFIFTATNAEINKLYLLIGISVFDQIIGITSESDSGEDGIVVADPDLKNLNYTSWFHLCIVMQQPSCKFYLNGSPLEQYIEEHNISTKKTNNLEIKIGDPGEYGGNGSFFLTNVFDKALTAVDAKNLYKCECMEGDIVSWKDITSKSREIKFYKDIDVVKDTVPCPPYNPVDCLKGDSQSPNGPGGDPESSSGETNPSSTSGDRNPDSSSGFTDPISSSGGSYPGSSSINLDPFMNSAGSPGSSGS